MELVLASPSFIDSVACIHCVAVVSCAWREESGIVATCIASDWAVCSDDESLEYSALFEVPWVYDWCSADASAEEFGVLVCDVSVVVGK